MLRIYYLTRRQPRSFRPTNGSSSKSAVKISCSGLARAIVTNSASGQGPYFGQYTWFARFHPEKIVSATDRYAKETERVIGVLDGWLQSRKWLVGDKCTFADLSFVTWSHIAEGVFSQFGKSDVLDKYPRYSNWCKAMNDRASVKEAVARIAAGRAEHGLPP